MKLVTDPALLAQLNGGGGDSSSGGKVTDPALLAQLNNPATGLEKLPPAAGAPQNPVYVAPPSESIGQRIKGSAEAGAALATGALGGAAGQLYGLGKTLTGGKYGTPQGAAEGEAAGVNLANKLTYQPRTQTGQAITQGVGKALSPLQALPADAGLLGRIGEVPRGVLAGEEAAGAAGRVVGKGAATAAAKALPAIDEETRQLAQQAHQMGFRLTPEQVVGGKYSKIAGESLASVPLSGSNAEFNKGVFLRNLSEQAGIEGGKPTRKAFGQATKKVGKEIGALNQKYDVPIDRSATQAFKSNANGQLPEVQSVVNYYSDLISKSAKGGVLPGSTFRKINTKLNTQIKQTSNGDLKYALSNLQDDLLELQQKQMSPEDNARLNTLRRQYAIQRTIEPLAAKSPTGDIPPSALLGALTATKTGKSFVARNAAGDLGNLADIGARFLKEPKSSGTAERRLLQGIPPALASAAGAGAGVAGGAGALPAILGGVGATYGAANLYNRAGPAITRALIDRPPQ
jgi:hypothetical protein